MLNSSLNAPVTSYAGYHSMQNGSLLQAFFLLVCVCVKCIYIDDCFFWSDQKVSRIHHSNFLAERSKRSIRYTTSSTRSSPKSTRSSTVSARVISTLSDIRFDKLLTECFVVSSSRVGSQSTDRRQRDTQPEELSGEVRRPDPDDIARSHEVRLLRPHEQRQEHGDQRHVARQDLADRHRSHHKLLPASRGQRLGRRHAMHLHS